MSPRQQVSDTIQKIVQKIVSDYSPQKDILFGSYACGEPDKDSDIDLLVVMETRLPPLERQFTLRRAIGPVDIPLDVFVLTPEEFNETMDVIGGIAHAPAKYGRVVYEKS